MRQTSLHDRMRIHQMAREGHPDDAIALALGWAVPTVRKWRRRAERDPTDLSSPMGRPAAGALSTFHPRIRQVLSALREHHPGWGPDTLEAELPAYLSDLPSDLPRPSRSGIARWLKGEGRTEARSAPRPLPQSPTAHVTAPHEQWEMDARGYEKVPDVGVVTLIQVNDAFSRAKVESYPCVLGEKRASRHPTTEDYQLILRGAFTEWGLPDRLSVDHDSVFSDNSCPSPFPTRLHLWLIGLGVELVLGRKRQPTDRGITERSHQTWADQVLRGQTYRSWAALREALVERRRFLNERLGCAACGGQPPLLAHPRAREPRRRYRPEAEADLLELSRVEAYLCRGKWYRRTTDAGVFSLGGQPYGLGVTGAKEEVEITFDPGAHRWEVRNARGEQIGQLPAKGLNTLDLMGEKGSLVGLRDFQLSLPYSPHEWRVAQLCQPLGDTTL